MTKPSSIDRVMDALRNNAATSLTESELYTLLLGRIDARKVGVTGLHPNEVASMPFDKLHGLGMTKGSAAAVCAAFELGRRAQEIPANARPACVRGPEDVLPHVRDIVPAKREHFVVLLLNARHEVMRRETVSIGSLNASIVHPREVFLPAILHSAASIVLVHNHPSGDPEPSEEDLSITKRLREVGEVVGIGVLDHVIVGVRGHVSFRSRNLL